MLICCFIQILRLAYLVEFKLYWILRCDKIVLLWVHLKYLWVLLDTCACGCYLKSCYERLLCLQVNITKSCIYNVLRTKSFKSFAIKTMCPLSHSLLLNFSYTLCKIKIEYFDMKTGLCQICHCFVFFNQYQLFYKTILQAIGEVI